MAWVEMCSRGLISADINHPSLYSNLGNGNGNGNGNLHIPADKRKEKKRKGKKNVIGR